MSWSSVQRCRNHNIPRPPPSIAPTFVKSSNTIRTFCCAVTASRNFRVASRRTILPLHSTIAMSPTCSIRKVSMTLLSLGQPLGRTRYRFENDVKQPQEHNCINKPFDRLDPFHCMSPVDQPNWQQERCQKADCFVYLAIGRRKWKKLP